MAILNPKVIQILNGLVNALDPPLYVEASELTETGEEAFFVDGLQFGWTQFILPKWWVTEHLKGFGGWLLTSGRTVRFVRQRLSHTNIYNALAFAMQKADNGEDLRKEEFKEELLDYLLRDGYYLQDFSAQVAEQIGILLAKTQKSMGKTVYSQRPAVGRFRSDMNKWLTSFEMVRRNVSDDNDERIRHLQYRIVMGYPNDLPRNIPGLTEAFREHFVRHCYVEAGIGKGVNNVWGYGPFKISVSCTGKTTPGEWITAIPPEAYRETRTGKILSKNLQAPLMVLAGSPIGYNKARTYRESGGWSRALPFFKPVPIVDGVRNGFECNAGPHLMERITEANVLIAHLDNLNVYRQVVGSDEDALNLDDILVTPDGKQRFRTKYIPEMEFSAEEWSLKSHNYVDVDGKPKTGYHIFPLLTPTGVLTHQEEGIDITDEIYSATVVVREDPRPDNDQVTKLLVDLSHKAMAKQIRTRMKGIDANGREWPIHLVISGLSISEKKLPTIPLSAIAGRAGIRYVEDCTHPIHKDREPYNGTENYLKWANRFDDLVKRVAELLRVQNESVDGLVDIYIQAENLDAERPEPWIHIGRGVVGPTRVCRLAENERHGTRSRLENAVPYQLFLRYLADKKINPSQESMNTLNLLIENYRNLEEPREEENSEIVYIDEQESVFSGDWQY